MRCLLPLLILALTLCESACSPSYLPDKSVIYNKSEPDNATLLEQARSAWFVLSDKRQTSQWPEAIKQYNHAVRILFDRSRDLILNKKKSHGTWDAPIFSSLGSASPMEEGTYSYEDLIPCDQISVDSHLEERVNIAGLGIPVVGLAVPVSKDSPEIVRLQNKGNIHTLTAILDFGKTPKQSPTLRLIPRIETEQIAIGSQQHLLAADFSAPIKMFWEGQEIARSAILGAFRPKKTSDYMGLYFSEPYRPNKIPVLFTHGLMSSPSTFANLTNRLMVDPVIRHHFQFWYFGYPTGNSWVTSAKVQREALASVMKNTSKNSQTNNLVMVGHSMGGLITRLNNSEHPWGMTDQLIKNTQGIGQMSQQEALRYLDSILKDSKSLKRSQDAFFFTPIPQTKRIVFMATPHQGSDFANTWIGILGQRLISLPQALVQEVINIGTLNKDMILINPERLEMEFTSIRQLSPDSPFIRGLQEIRPKASIPVHSIVGDQGDNDSPQSSDGIVDYSSSHLDWATSECIVPAGHSVQECDQTAREMQRILRLHLKDNHVPMTSEDKMNIPTVWSKVPSVALPNTRQH
jgi:pimeloyl-ACP methyl ester carboxylesterase